MKEQSMKIKFPFVVKQVSAKEVEVQFGDSGLPLPQVIVSNASQIMREYNLSNREMDVMIDKATDSAVEQLVRDTITITGV
jgi:hypothetical protein